VVAGDGTSLGYFRSKLISIGGGFHVFDDRDQSVAEVKGNWKGWDFKFVTKSGREDWNGPPKSGPDWARNCSRRRTITLFR
jgi:hypothetical protein